MRLAHILLFLLLLHIIIIDTNAFIIPATKVIKKILETGKANKGKTWVEKVKKSNNNEQNKKELGKFPGRTK
jgi:hypothetical protein